MCFRPTEMNRKVKKCPSCQTANPPALKQCKNCGADLPEAATLITRSAGAVVEAAVPGIAPPGGAVPEFTPPGIAMPGVAAPGVAAPQVVMKDKDLAPGAEN